MSTNLSDEQLTNIKARMTALPEGPWFVSDCEGDLQVWREGALRHVTRNEHGEIDGYSLPGSYSPSEDLIAEWEIDTWDAGEDPDDDAKREVAYFLAAARGLVPELVEEIERLRADIAGAARQAADGMGSASELLAELAKRVLPAAEAPCSYATQQKVHIPHWWMASSTGFQCPGFSVQTSA